MKTSIKYTIAFSFLLWLTGCVYQGKHHDTRNLLPESYGNLVEEKSAQLVSEPERVWWSKFGLTELNILVAELNKRNYDLRIARQRVLRAQACLLFFLSNNSLLFRYLAK